jgi:hypothetical protein
MQADTVVTIRLEACDLSGNAISTVDIGEEFLLRVFVQDLRVPERGVFAAFLDVFYSQSLVSVAGPITAGPNYFLLPGQGDISHPGMLDEIGAMDGFGVPVGELLLLSLRFRADALGTVTFFGDPPDNFPFSDILVYGWNDPVPIEDVEFGSVSITVVPPYNPTPDELLEDLINYVAELDISSGIANALDAKLQNALDALQAANGGQRNDVVNKLCAFMHSVEAQAGKALTQEQAHQLLDAALEIIAMLI